MTDRDTLAPVTMKPHAAQALLDADTPLLASLPFVRELTVDAYYHSLRSRLHGPEHWDRVARNGLRIGYESGADLRVVLAFALLHDAFRVNDDADPAHGHRAAAWAYEHRLILGPALTSEAAFGALSAALAYHADGTVSEDATLGTCWDADRLDLWRVGITPEVALLSTAAGRRICADAFPEGGS